MRRAERADAVVWLGLTLIAVLALTWLRPRGLPLSSFGLVVEPELLVAPVVVAAAAAGALISARGVLASVGWPVLQLISLAATTAWTAALVAMRRPSFDGAEVGTYVGNTLSPLLGELHRTASWAPPIAVGVGAGLAIVLMNAAVQSLAGAVQARRLVPVVSLSPGAAMLADGLQVVALLSVCAVLALSAMASERGRGLLWSTSLGLLSGVLLFGAALSGFASTAAGLGMLCIYYLRRRSLMIVVAGLGVGASLLVAAAFGWSWPAEFGAASALRIADPGQLAASVVLATLAVTALGGPTHRESWRKVRGTPAWPVMLTGLVAAFLAVLTRPSGLGVVPAAAVWLPLLAVAASAPPRSAGMPTGPGLPGLLVTTTAAVAAALLLRA